MGRELDARVATALGLDVVGEAWAWESWDGPGWFVEDSEWVGRSLQPVWLAHCVCELYADEEPDEWTPTKMLGHYPGCLEVVAFYCDRIEVARAMEDWIEEHNLQLQYADAMDTVLHDQGYMPTSGEDYTWTILHATPEQRCRAFLAAMGK